LEGSGRSLHREVEDDVKDRRRSLHSCCRVRHRGSSSTTPIGPGVTCSSLSTISGARQSPPKGRLRNGLLWESACRRGIEDELGYPRRSLPSTADVQRSAVSVGFAAGRLTGTRGTLKADVDHSIVRSGRTSKVEVDHSHRPGVTCSSLPTTLGARQSPPKGRLRNGLFGSRLAGVGSRMSSMIHVDHSHRRLTSNVPQSPSASPPGD
jgi:hypothetical protein